MATLLNYSAVNTTAGLFADNAEKQRAAALAYGAVTAIANEETDYNLIFAGLTAQESQLQQRSNTLNINPVFAEMSTLNTVGDDIKINVTGDQADETAAALRLLMRSSPTAKKLLSIVAEEAENSGGVFTVKTDDGLASGGTVVSGLYRTSDPNSIYLNTSNRKNVLDIAMTIVHESGHALGPTLMDHGADHDLISKAVAAELAANAGITGAEKEIVTFDGKAVTAGEVVAPAASTFAPPPPAPVVTPAPVITQPPAVTPATPPLPNANGGVTFTPLGGTPPVAGGSMTNYVTGMQQLTGNNTGIANTGMNAALSIPNMNYTMPAMDTSWLNSFMSQIGGSTGTMGGMGTTPPAPMPAMTLPDISAMPMPSIYNMEAIFDTSKMLSMDMFALKPISATAPETKPVTKPVSGTTTPVSGTASNVVTANPPEITSVFADSETHAADDGHVH